MERLATLHNLVIAVLFKEEKTPTDTGYADLYELLTDEGMT